MSKQKNEMNDNAQKIKLSEIMAINVDNLREKQY